MSSTISSGMHHARPPGRTGLLVHAHYTPHCYKPFGPSAQPASHNIIKPFSGESTTSLEDTFVFPLMFEVVQRAKRLVYGNMLVQLQLLQPTREAGSLFVVRVGQLHSGRAPPPPPIIWTWVCGGSPIPSDIYQTVRDNAGHSSCTSGSVMIMYFI